MQLSAASPNFTTCWSSCPWSNYVLATFVPKGKTIWEFLNLIEAAYEAAWLLDLNLLPALMVRARMPQPGQAVGGNA